MKYASVTNANVVQKTIHLSCAIHRRINIIFTQCLNNRLNSLEETLYIMYIKNSRNFPFAKIKFRNP